MNGVVSMTDMPKDPLGGKPPAGSKPFVDVLDYQVKYQRAFEAVLWSMPAIGVYGFHRLPASEGPFFAALRLYWPDSESLDGPWTPPRSSGWPAINNNISKVRRSNNA